MATIKLKVARIGNSRGVRIPAASLRRYRIGETVLMEERSEGILLRPTGPAVEKLSWEDTAREMAAGSEDWAAWDSVLADGLQYVSLANTGTGRNRRAAVAVPEQAQINQAPMKRSEIRWTALDLAQGFRGGPRRA
jgi:antitoxin component of MazEF toxin-antitoxin module